PTPPQYQTSPVTFTLRYRSYHGGGPRLHNPPPSPTRRSSDLTANSCNSFSADAGTYTSPDNTVTTGHCYRYTYTIKDNVSNTSSSAANTAKLESSTTNVCGPAPGEQTGSGNQYYDAPSKTQFF